MRQSGKTGTALSAIESQKKARAGLASEQSEAAGTLAGIKGERASVAAKGAPGGDRAASIHYGAELVGADTNSERAVGC
jgi:hypothetical protein